MTLSKMGKYVVQSAKQGQLTFLKSQQRLENQWKGFRSLNYS